MIKRLSACIKEYTRDTILTPIFVIFEVAFDVLIPMMMAQLIDKGIEAGSMENIVRYGVLLVVMALVALLFGALSGRFAAKAATGFSRNLRREMYRNVQDFSFSNIDKFSTGGIITRLTTDVTNVQMAFMMIIRIAVRCPIMLICAWALTFTINPKLALIFLVVIPILALGLYLIMTNAHPIFERVFKKYDWLNNVVQENLLGIRVVKSFVREDHERAKFGNVSNEIFTDFTKAEKLISFNAPLMQLCVYGCMLTVSWVGAHLVVGGEITTGNLTSMFSYIMMILMSLMMCSMVLVQIILARASAERIYELLSEESDLKNPEHPVTEVKDGSVVFENVSFSYANDPSKECLKDVNLTIKSGETVGILGGTGTSKTTLVQLIPRLYDATEGRVLVGGVDVRDYDMETLRQQVAMVLQKNVLFSGSIKENLRWGDADATDEQMVHMCRLAQADPFIQEFPDKYNTHIEQGGSNVSGGQKQRLCIARALLKRPKILILDDSTSAVDTKTDALIRQAFRNEIPDTTKFIIAQRISSIEDADKILVMEGGKISAMGTHQELLQSCQTYREIYDSQTKGGSDDE
ncbi:MAG: ABC transporter ATP-binding protein/permease [Pseudoflavonifractor capillosus]|uniref:ABC transporter ATP-binding protein n=1 Tax=Pseudoflavonifractor capillosus TaxID=106588 RepID=UPI0023F76326|nr:ABC transporter ATP-binding protein [Pseudoflavonifractor capillosus]MCI5928058.1 ABC transporter ATP-binding protein/permease [Pseudoflavonifractor capillosus]MDY4660712.1 ABC transporter ATP-binding protein [Pseudoflavonifractor capillosus]